MLLWHQVVRRGPSLLHGHLIGSWRLLFFFRLELVQFFRNPNCNTASYTHYSFTPSFRTHQYCLAIGAFNHDRSIIYVEREETKHISASIYHYHEGRVMCCILASRPSHASRTFLREEAVKFQAQNYSVLQRQSFTETPSLNGDTCPCKCTIYSLEKSADKWRPTSRSPLLGQKKEPFT